MKKLTTAGVAIGVLLVLSYGSVRPVPIQARDQCFRYRRPIVETAMAAELMDGNRRRGGARASHDSARLEDRDGAGMEGVMNASQIAAAALVVGASAFVSLRAQTPSQPYSGEGDYQVYCSSCHGTAAKGDGVLANSLKKHPPDLTQLARRNDGVFPEEQVSRAIDGRRNGHSESDMPAWAEVLAKSTESLGEQNAAVRIKLLVEYLQTLQVK